MMPTTLTKSRFVSALECPRKLAYIGDPRYVNTRSENELLEALADGGHQVGKLAQLMYPNGVEITAVSVDEQVRETARLLEADKVTLFEPTFRHGNLIVRVDILVKAGNSVELIEVKSKGFHPEKDSFSAQRLPIASEWWPYLSDVAFQLLVLEEVRPEWQVTPFLMLLDKSAPASVAAVGSQFQIQRAGRRVEVSVVRGFDPRTLQPPLLRTYNITDEIQTLRANSIDSPAGTFRFEKFVDFLARAVGQADDIPPCLGAQCKRCEFYCQPEQVTDQHRSGWGECMQTRFHRGSEIPRTETIFGLWNFRKTEQLLSAERFALGDVTDNDFDVEEEVGKITRSHRHWLQVEEARGVSDRYRLERESLREALSSWRLPLHFIDFETSRPALPFHKGRKPHDLLLFQFSHHILDTDGRLRHANQCLVAEPGVPPSFEVVRALRRALSGDFGTVVHWWDHERTVLKEIREQISESFETDRKKLTEFIDVVVGTESSPGRLADLGRLVLKTAFFEGTRGSSSIKKVLPAVLAQSDLVRHRYGQGIYGTGDMPSLNFPPGWVWLVEQGDQVRDPYELLDPLFLDKALRKAIGQGEDEETGEARFIANGGAAMVAYAQLQNRDLPASDRKRLEDQLKRYCELDTLAMVMVYEALQQWSLRRTGIFQ